MTEAKLVGRLLSAMFLIAVLAGCSTSHGFDRGQLSQRLGENEPKQITDQDIRSAMARKPQLRFPFKLAVELGSNECYLCKNITWREEDKQQILAWGEHLKQVGVISEIAIVPHIFEMKDLKAIRLAAAQQGADAVLIIRSAAEVDRYMNFSSILYVTVVGLWIVPGSDADALVLMRGAMYDVANAYLYATVEAEGQSHTYGPSMLLEDKDAIAVAQRTALGNFGPELVKHLEALKPPAQAAAQ